MAQNSRIYKANLSIADMDRHYYAEHTLTLACHPSETEERLMIRILAFALNAHPDLLPAGGIAAADEPDLWKKDLTGSVELWIELGQPDERRILKACGRSREVIVYTFGNRPELWFASVKTAVSRAGNLRIVSVDADSAKNLARLAGRTMGLQVSIEDGDIWVRTETDSVPVVTVPLQ